MKRSRSSAFTWHHTLIHLKTFHSIVYISLFWIAMFAFEVFSSIIKINFSYFLKIMFPEMIFHKIVGRYS